MENNLLQISKVPGWTKVVTSVSCLSNQISLDYFLTSRQNPPVNENRAAELDDWTHPEQQIKLGDYESTSDPHDATRQKQIIARMAIILQAYYPHSQRIQKVEAIK